MKNINIKALLTVLGFWAAVGVLYIVMSSLSEQQVHILSRTLAYVFFALLTVWFSVLMYQLIAVSYRK
jgi:hypothetical protein